MTLFNYHAGCVTSYLWMKITCKKGLEPCSMYKSQYVHWTIRMPLIMIKKAHEEEKEAPSCTLCDPYTVCPTMLFGLATSPNHSTTEWLHSLWSQSTPISPRYKLCLHTVSADHLLVQHCLLKTDMTEHGGGRGGWLSGAVLVRSFHVWLDKKDDSAQIL